MPRDTDDLRSMQRKLAEAMDDELFDELKARSKSLVVAMMVPDGDDAERLKVCFHGGRYTCIGMAEQVSNDLVAMSSYKRKKRR